MTILRRCFAIGPLMLAIVFAIGASSLPAHAQFGSKFTNPTEVLADQNGTWNVGQAGTWTVTATQATGTNFHMVCDAGCGGASSFADGATFTAGTTPINVIGGWYSASATNCVSGQACAPQITIDRKLFMQAFQGTSPWAVSGTFWQTTQPVSIASLPPLAAGSAVIGHVIVDTAPSTAVTNAGTFAVQAAQSGTWNVAQSGTWTVTGAGGTFPVTGTFWQTTQPVSIAAMPSTPVTGIFWQSTQPVSGTFWQTTQPVSLASLPALAAGSAVIGHVIVDTAPSTAVTNAGTFAVQAAQSGTWNVAQSGTWTVTGAGGTFPVTGTFWQATQPVSIASMPSTPVTGTFWQSIQPVSGTFFQATQPVSGTVTANQGSANGTPWNENIAQVNGVAPSQANALPVQNSSTLAGEPGVIPVVVLQGAPPTPATTNPLLYRAALKTYCYQNLAGCGPPISGGTLK